MRVTKIIREYVEKTINAKLVYGEPTEKFHTARKLLDETELAVEAKIEAYAKTLVEEANSGLPEGFKIQVLPASVDPFTIMTSAPGGFFVFGALMAAATWLTSRPKKSAETVEGGNA